jgi:predicted SprT family Zn-dependent metalloprotease
MPWTTKKNEPECFELVDRSQPEYGFRFRTFVYCGFCSVSPLRFRDHPHPKLRRGNYIYCDKCGSVIRVEKDF